MNTFIRFGKRIALPSMRQIRHELRAFCAEEEVREECAAEMGLPVSAGWDEIYARRPIVPAATRPLP
jgi:hypothetical protein